MPPDRKYSFQVWMKNKTKSFQIASLQNSISNLQKIYKFTSQNNQKMFLKSIYKIIIKVDLRIQNKSHFLTSTSTHLLMQD